MSKVLKHTLWNYVFHKKRLQMQKQEVERLRNVIKTADDFLQQLNICTDLQVMLQLHKDIWRNGIRNKNIGPCEYGMFRTNDILTMRANEVYLGDIYGLWTFNIATWEQQKGNKYGDGATQWGLSPDITLYEIVACQYRNHLVSNVTAIKNEAIASLEQY